MTCCSPILEVFFLIPGARLSQGFWCSRCPLPNPVEWTLPPGPENTACASPTLSPSCALRRHWSSWQELWHLGLPCPWLPFPWR